MLTVSKTTTPHKMMMSYTYVLASLILVALNHYHYYYNHHNDDRGGGGRGGGAFVVMANNEPPTIVMMQREAVCFADGTCRVMMQDYDNDWSTSDHYKKTFNINGISTSTKPIDECTIFMAPSTLGESTSMGIYTAKKLTLGQAVNFPEIAVPILFREWGEHTPGFENDGVLWDRYIWEGHVIQIHPYDNTNIENSRSAFIPGVGCTVNSVLDMNNIVSVHTSTYDNLKYRRYRDVGSGAFTPYHNAQTTVAVTEIEPGSELFASYGDSWIPEIPGAQVTFKVNLQEAEEFLLNDYYPFIEQHNDSLTNEMKEELYKFATSDFPIQNNYPILSNLPRGVSWSEIEHEILLHKETNSSSIVEKKLKATKPLPDEYEDDPRLVVKEMHKKQSRRSVDWLKDNGYCQDHIKPGKSSVPQAGRGAFATRDLPTGTIVGYSPLVHIGLYGYNIFAVDIPIIDPSVPPYKPPKEFRKQYDLIINYSFGHPNSSLLFTPYGGMVNYINHASERTAPYKPNVSVRWPTKELVAHKPHYLHKTPEDLKNTIDKIGLSFEYVALRDIHEGEEVFLDYGPEWEKAWEEHMNTWKPNNPEYDQQYIHSSEWIESTFRTVAELETNPYPPNLETVCFESYTTKINTTDGTTFYSEWVPVLRPETPHRVHCNVLERNDPIPGSTSNVTYTVELIIVDDEVISDSVEPEENTEPQTIVVQNVPTSGIVLTDKIFTEDWHLPNAFRHPIILPDSLMPKGWLNGPVPKPF